MQMCMKKSIEFTNGVIRSCKSKKDTILWAKGQTMIYKTLHRKLKIEQHEPHNKSVVNPGAVEG